MMFSGKTLLITGGSRGIGKKICFEFIKSNFPKQFKGMF